MASSDNRNSVEDRRECADRAGTTIEYTEKETALKKEKARTKSNFTRARNKLSSLLEEEQPSRRTVQDVCSNLDTWMEHAMGGNGKIIGLVYKICRIGERQ